MDEPYCATLHDQTQAKLDAILEYVQDIPAIKTDIHGLKDRMDNAEMNIEIISEVVKGHSAEFRRVNGRLDGMGRSIKTLEAAVKKHNTTIQRHG